MELEHEDDDSPEEVKLSQKKGDSALETSSESNGSHFSLAVSSDSKTSCTFNILIDIPSNKPGLRMLRNDETDESDRELQLPEESNDESVISETSDETSDKESNAGSDEESNFDWEVLEKSKHAPTKWLIKGSNPTENITIDSGFVDQITIYDLNNKGEVVKGVLRKSQNNNFITESQAEIKKKKEVLRKSQHENVITESQAEMKKKASTSCSPDPCRNSELLSLPCEQNESNIVICTPLNCLNESSDEEPIRVCSRRKKRNLISLTSDSSDHESIRKNKDNIKKLRKNLKEIGYNVKKDYFKAFQKNAGNILKLIHRLRPKDLNDDDVKDIFIYLEAYQDSRDLDQNRIISYSERVTRSKMKTHLKLMEVFKRKKLFSDYCQRRKK